MEEPPPPPETKILSMRRMDPNAEKSEFYRTKPCKFFFERGLCLKGDLCNYSHDPELYEEFLREHDYTGSDECSSSDESYESESSSGSEDDSSCCNDGKVNGKAKLKDHTEAEQNKAKSGSDHGDSKAGEAKAKVQTNEKKS